MRMMMSQKRMTRRYEIRLCPGGRSGLLLSAPENRGIGSPGALIRPRSKRRKTVRTLRGRHVCPIVSWSE